MFKGQYRYIVGKRANPKNGCHKKIKQAKFSENLRVRIRV